MAESRLDQMLQTRMLQICGEERQGLHRFAVMVVEISNGTVLPKRIFERSRKVFVKDMTACVRLEAVLPQAVPAPFAFFPVRQGSAVTLVIIAFKAYLPTFILTDKLAGVLVNLDLGCVAHICVTRFYDAYYQSAAACILYYLADVPVCHAVSTAGAWLHDKLMHTVRANCFVPHFYV